MRNLMIFAVILVVAGTYMAQMADKISSAGTANATAVKSAPVTVAQAQPDNGGRTVKIPRDHRGHFQTDGRIDGQRLSFMVDTGASVIALTENDAARIGKRPSRGDYNATVSTANGQVKAARVRLASVDIGGLVVRDVDAMVLPDGVLSENLLGLSYLSKLKRFEMANGQMVLE
ncbi:TIGR02281 family clan AA aspartic protease [Bradyrhizobium prioriisuperbiae]|uniref:TIGR02281 family clan AA aspartic protease n=1 Tax=Bradyrhizobium prioriisuperbiae TaxID=2854389 RepID=UPI0028EC6FC9|nr:TIGR02281 family clan AA aspartic protease [Bradyrhizobium prioritasuperba]